MMLVETKHPKSLESRQGRNINFIRETALHEVKLKRFVILILETEKFSASYSHME
jgi:hypothetical protein